MLSGPLSDGSIQELHQLDYLSIKPPPEDYLTQ
jgi:hypothetical protein